MIFLMSKPRFEAVGEAAAALRRMTMAELRALSAIKSAGNISRAAMQMGVSQPALSQHVRELEDKLGVSLFVRHRRGLDPTPFGSTLLRLADAMRVDFGIAAEELVRASREDQVPLRVGSMPVTSAGLLAVAIGRFVGEPSHPDAVIVEGPRELLMEHLRHGRIDLFVGRLPSADATSDLNSETLFLDGAVVIASSRHPLARKSRVLLPSLLSHPWILPAEDTSFRQQIEESIRNAGHPLPPARIATYSMLSFPAVVATSDLLGFLPTSLFASGTLSSSLQRLPDEMSWIPSPLGVLTRKNMADPQRVEKLLAILRSVAASANGALTLN